MVIDYLGCSGTPKEAAFAGQYLVGLSDCAVFGGAETVFHLCEKSCKDERVLNSGKPQGL